MQNVKEGDLVMLRMQTKFGYSNTWWRVLFIDNDNTFHGKLERANNFEYDDSLIGDIVQLSIDNIKTIYTQSMQFCYSNKVTVCDCEGLCRDKM